MSGRFLSVPLPVCSMVTGAANVRIRPVRGVAYPAGAVVTQEVR